MLPSVEDWLSDSWSDFKNRFWPLAAVLALSGLAAAAGAFLPLAPAALAHWLGAGSPWLIWGAAFFLSLFAALWLSTWGQAAAILAASGLGAAEALSEGWRRTPAFAWTLGLASLAVLGGFVLLVLPGFAIAALVVFAVFYQLGGEASGLAAVELSWARARPRFGAVAGRLAILATLLWAPSMIPYVGWLLSPLFAPFGVVAVARLAADLRALAPEPERPRLGALVAGLGLVLALAGGAAAWGAWRLGAYVGEKWASGSLAVAPPDPETAASMLAVLQGQGSEEDARRALAYAVALSSAAGKTP